MAIQLASALREHETLSAAEVKQALAGEKVIKSLPAPPPPKREPPVVKEDAKKLAEATQVTEKKSVSQVII